MKSNTDSEPTTMLLKLLSNKRSLKAFLKGLPIVKAREICEKLNEVHAEIEEELAREEAEKNRNMALMDSMRQELIKAGVPSDQITNFFSKNV